MYTILILSNRYFDSHQDKQCYNADYGNDLSMCPTNFCLLILFLFTFMFGFFLHFVSVTSCAGHGRSKPSTIYWFWYMGRTPVSYLQEFCVIYERKLSGPKNMENK